METATCGHTEVLQGCAQLLAPIALTAEHAVLYDGTDMGMAWDGYEAIPDKVGISEGSGFSAGNESPAGKGSSTGQNPASDSVHSTAEAKRQLRIGQMNNALHGVHVGVGYKSFLF